MGQCWGGGDGLISWGMSVLGGGSVVAVAAFGSSYGSWLYQRGYH